MVETWQAMGGRVSVRELMPLPVATLRLRRPSPDDITRIGALIGTPLPMVPNRASGYVPRVLWIGPDEWLIIGSDVPGEAIEAAAADAAAALCVSVGDGRCSLDVTGADAADLLAKGTSIDLHADIFAEDMLAMTLLAQANVIIDRPPGLAGFRLIFDVSLRDYVRHWFADAVVEFA